MVDQKIVDHYADMDIDELEYELSDIDAAIEDERECGVIDNERIGHLFVERAYVRKLIRELMAG